MILQLYNGETTVSSCDYDALKQFKWTINPKGYLVGLVNGKTWRIHRYILQVLDNQNIDEKVVDHINGNKLDNTRDNLRAVTQQENSRNRPKRSEASQYYGVFMRGNRWVAQITVSDKKQTAYFDNELHAAWQYNAWVKDQNLSGYRLNEITEPRNFLPYTKQERQRELPTNVKLQPSGRYLVRICLDGKYKHVGVYDSVEVAVQARDKEKQNHNKLQIQTNQPDVLRNDAGQAIIPLYKNKSNRLYYSR